ncbi:hypothetical protein LMG27174_02331 [Paraburkholderia rhynchosiae]|uniref:Transport-associated OB type 2 domain-containing protein n=1 Tax=Paraburkholderia rhynchosiae TaxID=487049 RepID=A0A6J5AMN1_9BURK|nr:hypothetical protein LMG27174_02331 [Paraburkholderia rhynchosiae]
MGRPERSPRCARIPVTLEQRDGSLYFCTEHWRLDVSNYAFTNSRVDPQSQFQPQPYVLGVRAEDVRIGELREGLAEHAKVLLVEPMGNHRVVWLDYVQIASIDQRKTPVTPGDTLSFSLHSAHVSLFGAAGGVRLQRDHWRH